MNKPASLMVGHEGKDAMYVQSLVYIIGSKQILALLPL